MKNNQRLFRRSFGPAVAAALLLVSCGGDDPEPVSQVELSPDDVHVANVTAAAAAEGEDLVVEMLLWSPTPDRLVSAQVDSSVGGGAVLAAATTTGETDPIDVIDLPADQDVVLAADRDHVLVTDLAASLDDGSRFNIALNFEDSPPRTVTVRVTESGG